MFDIQDIDNIESNDCTQEEYFASLQQAINSLTAWSFQGSYGRAMMQAIEDGYCILGREHTRDYWGSRIPSRDEVKQGTKGSYDYVVQHQGQDWADYVSSI